MSDRLSTKLLDAAALQRLNDALLKQGLLIEAGWVALRLAAVPADAPAVQLEEMRMAFFAGAQHLFGSLMTLFDPDGDEVPTEADLERMSLVANELDAFVAELKLRVRRTEGNA